MTYIPVKNIKSMLLTAAAAAILTACSGPSFKVEGTVEGADDASLVLERANASGLWLAIDSTHTGSDGHFSLSVDAPEHPDLYRLSYGGGYIYLPVDSIETLTLTASAKDFGKDFTLTGSDQANLMTQMQQRLSRLPMDKPDSVAAFKRWVLSNVVLAAEGRPSVMQYYALTANVGGRQLFDVNTPQDAQAFAAVATAYQQYRPDDPRAAMLKNIALEAQRNAAKAKGKKTVLKAQQIEFFDITLPDNSLKIRLHAREEQKKLKKSSKKFGQSKKRQ